MLNKMLEVARIPSLMAKNAQLLYCMEQSSISSILLPLPI